MWRFFVYIHRKADDGEPFYVGKGARADRATAKIGRNVAWKRIVAKHGFTVETFACCIDDKAAQEVERALIARLGRRHLGTGPLVNMTEGGDGHAGLPVSEETRRKRSENAKRPRSEAWIKSMRAARKGGGNGGVVKKGDRLPAAWRAAISAGRLRGARAVQ